MVFKKLSKILEFNYHNKSIAEDIQQIVALYLLGHLKYSQAVKNLMEFGEHQNFKLFLTSLNEDEIDFIMIGWRGYYKYGLKYINKYSKLLNKQSYKDKKLLRKLKGKIDPKDIKIIDYPKFNEVLDNSKKVVFSKAYYYKTSVIKDKAIGFEDIVSEMYIRIMQSYRQYIFGYGVYINNNNVLYSTINRSLSNKGLDILCSTNRDKRIVNIKAKSINTLQDCEGEKYIPVELQAFL